MLSAVAMSAEGSPYKRPSSPTTELPMPPAKVPKTGTAQLQINYLKREKKETIPLATSEEPLPRLLRLVAEYDGVLQRHESLAGNLGACPVGPILLKRFERLFEGPPRILKSNSRDPNITWLDVVEFAQNKPEQFDLEKTRNGIRVCQFYLKQCRVEISEEDYVLIRSGMPQKLIPPQPILEDEEKELGVIDVLDRNLGKIIQTADQVSVRARQLVHRLKNRRAAILARREAEGDNKSVLKSNDPPASPAFEPSIPPPQPPAAPIIPTVPTVPAPPSTRSPTMPSSGFTAVNPRHSLNSEPPYFPPVRELPPEPVVNGTPPTQHIQHVAESKPTGPVAEDWMNRFLTPSERAAGLTAETIRRENINASQRALSRGETSAPSVEDSMRMASMSVRRQDSRRQSDGALPDRVPSDVSGPSVAIPSTPASLMPQQKPNTWNRDDGGPYKAEMISRMETMKRGERVIPPCDRCRRLHMDCIKNLTACLGCTKKHAKCSWKDVTLEELESTAPAARERAEKEVEATIPSSSDWDNILKQQKGDGEPSQESPTSNSAPSADMMEISSSHKPSTPRMPSPPRNGTNGSGNGGPPSHSHESPRLNVRPPPLDQQLRDAAIDKPAPLTSSASHPSLNTYPTSRFSPFQRPPSTHQQQSLPPQPHHHHHQTHPPLSGLGLSKREPAADEGDRLAAVAAQVYRSASQNTARGVNNNETRTTQAS